VKGLGTDQRSRDSRGSQRSKRAVPPRSRGTRRRLLALAFGACAILGAQPAEAGLTGGPGLVAAYNAILDARFDRAAESLKQACPPAADEACRSLAAASLWWQILLNPESRTLDGPLTEQAKAAIAASQAWTRREPSRGEAWFYLAGSYAPLAQLRILRGERVAAARDANTMREALERALQHDPMLADARFGIGMYHYYAAAAPAAAKILRFLLLLPGGDRVKGLQEMQQARAEGQLLRGEADYQLHLIYLWYEQKIPQALDLLKGLDAEHPTNPLFMQRIAEVRSAYLHDPAASAEAWRALLARARARTVYTPELADVRARLGLANELVALNRFAEAIDLVAPIVEGHAAFLPGARERAEALVGVARSHLAK
jgi:hypothetical protein